MGCGRAWGWGESLGYADYGACRLQITVFVRGEKTQIPQAGLQEPVQSGDACQEKGTPPGRHCRQGTGKGNLPSGGDLLVWGACTP